MRFYIVQETVTGFRPLPYTESGFPNRSAAYRHMVKHGNGWCKTSNREASQHVKGES
jgi:hypothetical protein